MTRADNLWIFGYGSLLWRPGFSYTRRVDGYITGWSRRFWQKSPDHRGVPDSPGRVVTLVRDPDAVCWGAGYCIAAAGADAILQALDFREKAGYSRLLIPVFAASSDEPVVAEALVYIADEHNPNFTGEVAVENIARVAHTASGPSGNNREYVLRLADALRNMQVDDAHVFAVEAALVAITS